MAATTYNSYGTDVKRHIQCNWHVAVTDKLLFVKFRRWCVRRKDNTLQPTPAGIALMYSQWDNLKKAVEEIEKDVLQLISKARGRTILTFFRKMRCIHAITYSVFGAYLIQMLKIYDN